MQYAQSFLNRRPFLGIGKIFSGLIISFIRIYVHTRTQKERQGGGRGGERGRKRCIRVHVPEYTYKKNTVYVRARAEYHILINN